MVRKSRHGSDNLDGVPVIVILSHKRVSHLKQALHSARSARDYENHNLVVVVDGGDKSVEKLIRSTVSSTAVLILEDRPDWTAAKRISFALKSGLSFAFEILKAPYAVILEDDIVVSKDFLEFIAACHERFGKNPRFRGVNGFSQIPAGSAPSGSALQFVKLNYGLGWGWSINRFTYHQISSALDLPHPEGWIWDYAIEPYIRTGFVINPIRSRVRNIGFDSTAAHTSGESSRKLGMKIDSSFLSDAEAQSDYRTGLKLSQLEFPWREDCFNLSSARPLAERQMYWFQTIVRVLYELQGSSNAYIRHYSGIIRSRLSSLILQKYGNGFAPAGSDISS